MRTAQRVNSSAALILCAPGGACYVLLRGESAGWPRSGFGLIEEGRDSAGQGAELDQAPRGDGKCNREQTADGLSSGSATGKGETVR